MDIKLYEGFIHSQNWTFLVLIWPQLVIKLGWVLTLLSWFLTIMTVFFYMIRWCIGFTCWRKESSSKDLWWSLHDKLPSLS